MGLDNFQNKKIWIIGASSGIGYALAQNLSAKGAKLILSARREERLDALNQELGGDHTVLPLDVSDYEAVQKAVDSLSAADGTIDSVLYMAAIYNPNGLEKADITFIHNSLDINLKGAFNLVYALMPVFERRKKGQLVLCGSVAGYRGLPLGQPYCATKAAMINLAESLAAENYKNGIDIKLICPGFVKTPMTDKNKFEMPMLIQPDQAAEAIAKGLLSNSFEIHFPKSFTFILKIMRILPNFLYIPLASKLKQE